MKFSIIVPVYNTKKYLSEAIESVLNQANVDFEIIIIDDGSTDGSENIYKEYIKRYPDDIIAIKQKNSGQLVSRCQGISNANGDYCLFLDSDDMLVENSLQELRGYIEKYKMPDVVIFPFYYDRGGQLEMSKMLCNQEGIYEGAQLEYIYREIFEGTLMNSVCTKAVRRDVALKSIKNHEKYKELRCAEDRYQSIMMIKQAQRILYLTKAYYRYRIVDGSTTRLFFYDTISRFNTTILYDVELQCLEEWGMRGEEWKEKLSQKWSEYPLYVLDRFYNNVPKSEKKRVLTYPWNELLPKEIDIQAIQVNPNINRQKKLIWKWIDEKKYQSLRIYFWKKKIYKLFREVKRGIIKK